MGKNEKTSPEMATLAAKVLANPRSSMVSKKLAGCVLTQTADKKSPKRKK